METLSESMIGMRLGRYLIDAYLGAGSAGQVYRALDMYLHRPVALKILRPRLANDRDRLERFFAEARAASVIRHEHIIEYTDMHQDGPGGLNYLVMELLEGRTLTRAIRDSGRLVPERAVFIAAQVASALEAAHRAGIVHRDLKPDNLFLIHRMGTEDYVKVLDFGVARLRPDLTLAKATQAGVLIGTPAYMSPEQCMGERATPAADIYALGVILFEMLTGQLPFDRRTIPRLLMAHVIEEPPLIPEVPIALSKLVAQALAKQPGERPSSMAAMRDAMIASVGMEAFATQLASGFRPSTDAPPSTTQAADLLRDNHNTGGSHAQRNWLIGVAGLSVLILSVGGFLLQHQPPAEVANIVTADAGTDARTLLDQARRALDDRAWDEARTLVRDAMVLAGENAELRAEGETLRQSAEEEQTNLHAFRLFERALGERDMVRAASHYRELSPRSVYRVDAGELIGRVRDEWLAAQIAQAERLAADKQCRKIGDMQAELVEIADVFAIGVEPIEELHKKCLAQRRQDESSPKPGGEEPASNLPALVEQRLQRQLLRCAQQHDVHGDVVVRVQVSAETTVEKIAVEPARDPFEGCVRARMPGRLVATPGSYRTTAKIP
jgi:serine/threonine protein kinase